ncbi:c-type cytochrome [Undibacterium sp. Ji83W]|uniref:cytochrome c/ABC transporter substrate-binding protein n=1 Tax=Undibacterium sp. Ji83W TaxID=3413043 RepID=UPI003BF1C631
MMARFWTVLPVLLWLFSAGIATAADEQAWQRGQAMYHKGWNGQAACVRCHGNQGQGREEGGLRAPPLAGKPDQQHLQRALLEGVGSNGQTLHPLMPRYHIDAASLNDLLAYLNVIGTDTPGLTDTRLRVGVSLPANVYGAAIQAGLNRAFDQVANGVYGRKLELLVNPASDQVFVEVASLQAGLQAISYSATDANKLAVIGSLPLPGVANFSDMPASNNFYLLPSIREQASALLTQAALDARSDISGSAPDNVPGNKASQQLTLIYDLGNDPALHALLKELREQARVNHQSLREQIWSAKVRKPGEAVIYLGSAANLREVLASIGDGLVYASAIHIGHASLQLPPAQAARLRLLLPWHTSSPVFDLPTAYSDAAYAAGMVLIEALKRSGRQLGRAELLQQLDQLRDFTVAGFGKIGFHPGQHHGSHGGQLLAVDAEHGIFTVLRTW